ncbi:MAG: sugar phosphate nucleotidyltransferase [Bacilli bacterium]|nr:sugar phosphate nucleotidyltransferase [Bacilli bacterium]
MIKKAVIPVGGKGSRMYPMTKIYPKEFLPIVRDGVIRPAIFYLLEELVDAGIEEIALVITNFYQREIYESFFRDDDITDIDFKNKLLKIKKVIKYIENPNIHGFGHSLYFCREFLKDEDFILLLGDQIYRSNTNISCISQFLSVDRRDEEILLSGQDTPIEDVSKYGILMGNLVNNRVFDVIKMVEKPDIDYARDNLSTEGKFYSIFGMYLFNKDFMDTLYTYFDNKDNLEEEYNLTFFIDNYKNKKAFIPDGKTFDIGNVNSYKDSFVKY